jgi:hypothetical protein
MDALTILRFAIWGGLIYITVRTASERGRSVGLWALFAMFFPGVALICALCLSKQPPQEQAVTSLSLSAPPERAEIHKGKQGAA